MTRKRRRPDPAPTDAAAPEGVARPAATAETAAPAESVEAAPAETVEAAAPETVEAAAPETVEAAPETPPRARRLGRAPRLLAGAMAVAAVGISVVALLVGAAPPARAQEAMPGSAAALALATPTPEPTPSPTASPTPKPTPTPYPLMTLRTVIPPDELTGYVWPLTRARLTNPFGPSPWGEMIRFGQLWHDGVDLATGCGDTVYAAHDGVVLAAGRHYDDFVGWVGDLKPYYDWLTAHNAWNSVPIVIVIDDGNGYRSIYAHEASVSVRVGQFVKAGEPIGIEGATGLTTGCHLHYSIFNTLETARFELNPGPIKRNHLPRYEIARVDPLLVLPMRCGVPEQNKLRPYDYAMKCTGAGSSSTPAG